MIALSPRPRLDLGGVEPGIRLGHGKARLVRARDQGRQHAPLLFFVPEDDDRIEAEDVHMDSRGATHGRARFRHRLHHDRGLGDAEPRAAERLRHGDAEPSVLGDRGVELMREAALAIVLEPVSVVETRAKREDLGADLFLLGARRKIHAILMRSAIVPSRAPLRTERTADFQQTIRRLVASAIPRARRRPSPKSERQGASEDALNGRHLVMQNPGRLSNPCAPSYPAGRMGEQVAR